MWQARDSPANRVTRLRSGSRLSLKWRKKGVIVSAVVDTHTRVRPTEIGQHLEQVETESEHAQIWNLCYFRGDAPQLIVGKVQVDEHKEPSNFRSNVLDLVLFQPETAS